MTYPSTQNCPCLLPTVQHALYVIEYTTPTVVFI